MCGCSWGKVRDKDVNLFIGYEGGNINIDDGDIIYTDESGEERRKEFIEQICKYKKIEIANMLADLVENAEEA